LFPFLLFSFSILFSSYTCMRVWSRTWSNRLLFYFLFSLFLYLTFVSFVLFPLVLFSFSILFSSYTCMRVWSCTLSGRLCSVSSSFSKNIAEEDNQSLHNENNRVRTLRYQMNLTRTSAPSNIVSPLMHRILILSQTLFNFYLLFMA
jgi:hypothetical protein